MYPVNWESGREKRGERVLEREKERERVRDVRDRNSYLTADAL